MYKYFKKGTRRDSFKISHAIVNSFSVFENITRFRVEREGAACAVCLEFTLAVNDLGSK